MAKIETYSLDDALTANDKLVGSSYQPGGSYVTASYTLGQVRDYMSTAVGELQDRWSTTSFKFSGQDLYDLGDAESGILDLYGVSEDTYTKYWTLIPGVPEKQLVISNIVYVIKQGSVDFDVKYGTSLSRVIYDDSFYVFFYRNDLFDNVGTFMMNSTALDPAKKKEGAPLLLNITNSSLATEGDGEFGIWIEYKYLDFNTDF